MKLLVNTPETLMVDVRIDLRRPDIHVAEHLLNATKVGTSAQQMRRKTVP